MAEGLPCTPLVFRSIKVWFADSNKTNVTNMFFEACSLGDLALPLQQLFTEFNDVWLWRKYRNKLVELLCCWLRQCSWKNWELWENSGHSYVQNSLYNSQTVTNNLGPDNMKSFSMILPVPAETNKTLAWNLSQLAKVTLKPQTELWDLEYQLPWWNEACCNHC